MRSSDLTLNGGLCAKLWRLVLIQAWIFSQNCQHLMASVFGLNVSWRAEARFWTFSDPTLQTFSPNIKPSHPPPLVLNTPDILCDSGEYLILGWWGDLILGGED